MAVLTPSKGSCTFETRDEERLAWEIQADRPYKGGLVFPWGHGVVSTHITRKQFDDSDPDAELPDVMRVMDLQQEQLARNQIPGGQYQAVMIDEGHDFAAEWLKLVTQTVAPATNSLLVLYDDAQSIYERTRRKQFSFKSVGIQAQGRTTFLKINYLVVAVTDKGTFSALFS